MATWVIVNESCNVNYKENGVSHRTLPKELTVLEIVLAGEPLNNTGVDCLFVRYEGKYAIELPINDTTIGATSYATVELLRVALLALLNTNPCASGGGGGGTLQTVTDAGDTTDNTMTVTGAAGAQPTATVSNSQIRSGDNGTQLESTLNSDGTVQSTNNTDSTYTKLHPDGSISFAGLSGGTVGLTRWYFKKIHLTSAQIQNGSTTPIVLVAAAGAGTAIYARHDTTARCINGGVPAVATLIDIKSEVGATSQIEFDAIFLTSVAGNAVKGDDSGGINKDDCIIENDALVVVFDADNPAYDGTIDIYLEYSIITL